MTTEGTTEDVGAHADAFARWLRATHSPAHSRRTAERNAAFLLPHLTPGLRLLDAGCGPGSITLGLARAVDPGETIGLDLSSESIAAARAAGTASGVGNVRFEVGSVYDTPFEADTFDVVFFHAVLQHLDEPVPALVEAARVLKPGGIVALADADYGGSIIWPTSPVLDGALRLMERVRAHSGGDVFVGRKLGSLLAQAGFIAISGSASAGSDGTSEAAAATGEFWARYYETPEFREHVGALGWTSANELRAMATAWRAWGAAPGAYWARFWCQALARKP